MTYENEIIKILVEAGDKGLSVKKIAQHVYNAVNSLFCSVSYTDIYSSVSQYLKSNAKSKTSVIVHGKGRGVYKINAEIDAGQQLMIIFGKHDTDEPSTPKDSTTTELTLF